MSTCAATTEILEQRCRPALQVIRKDIDDLAAAVADRVWDRFEAEVRMATEDEFMFETAEMLHMLLASESMTAFQEAYDELLLERFNSLLKELEGSGAKGLDVALLELDGLRKQVWLREFVHELVSEALEEAKPGVGHSLRIMLVGLFRNPDQHVDSPVRHIKTKRRSGAASNTVGNQEMARLYFLCSLKYGAVCYLNGLTRP